MINSKGITARRKRMGEQDLRITGKCSALNAIRRSTELDSEDLDRSKDGGLKAVSKADSAVENHMVEIWFHIEKDEDGYPESKDWEALLCSCLGSPNQFQV